MITLVIVLSSLALLTAMFDLILALDERKRSQKCNTALTRYADAAVAQSEKRLGERLEALEKGIVPDFEKAKEAASAVNDFNAGITGILGFDPYSALQAQRVSDRGGDI